MDRQTETQVNYCMPLAGSTYQGINTVALNKKFPFVFFITIDETMDIVGQFIVFRCDCRTAFYTIKSFLRPMFEITRTLNKEHAL